MLSRSLRTLSGLTLLAAALLACPDGTGPDGEKPTPAFWLVSANGASLGGKDTGSVVFLRTTNSLNEPTMLGLRRLGLSLGDGGLYDLNPTYAYYVAGKVRSEAHSMSDPHEYGWRFGSYTKSGSQITFRVDRAQALAFDATGSIETGRMTLRGRLIFKDYWTWVDGNRPDSAVSSYPVELVFEER